MKRLNILLVLFVASVAVTGCSALTGISGEPTTDEDTMMVDESNSDSTQASDDVANGMEAMENADVLVELQAENFTFGEDEILVDQDSVVTVRVTNVSGSHDFVIDELGVNTGLIEEGSFVDVTIPTDQVGEFTYYCSVGSHRAQGMEGTLIIQ